MDTMSLSLLIIIATRGTNGCSLAEQKRQGGPLFPLRTLSAEAVIDRGARGGVPSHVAQSDFFTLTHRADWSAQQ